MASPRLVEPVIRFCAIISRHAVAREWAQNRLREYWGTTAEISALSSFTAGGFYAAEMGEGLSKVLVAFDDLVDPAGLADWKTMTNEWEDEYARLSNHAEPRPLNLDPGYITQAKLVLATIKDRDHRLYLYDGIFAEVTLNYMGGRWVHHRWSYPDYRTDEVAEFAIACRERLRAHLLKTGGFRRV